MFDAPFRSFANGTIELMFDTARVDKAKSEWSLPKTALELDFSYEFDGIRHRAEDVLEDTDTDALLIIKRQQDCLRAIPQPRRRRDAL